jgi:hypothetical protein
MNTRVPRSRAPLLGGIALAAVLLGTGVYVLRLPRSSAPTTSSSAAPVAPAQVTGEILSAALPAHRTLVGESVEGVGRPAPPPPSLESVLAAGLPFDHRLAAIHALPARLDSATRSALLATVTAPAQVPGLTLSQSHAFKNDCLNALGRQSEPAFRAELAARLRGMSADSAQHPAMRDYALQHLAVLGAEVDDGSAHLAALDGSDPALAATALLHLLARERTGALTPALRARAAETALRLAADIRVAETSRATALQVCARLKLPEARPIAEALARSDRTGIPLRIAAVAALGDLGGDGNAQAYLSALATGPETRLRIPAQSALKRFPKN